VGVGPQAIDGLTFNGGKVIFDATIPDNLAATNVVAVNTLTYNAAGGVVAIVVPQNYTPPQPDAAGGVNLLAQDNGLIYTQLVSAQTVAGAANAAAVTLVDQNGNSIAGTSGTINIQVGPRSRSAPTALASRPMTELPTTVSM
jgi:autotransporter family porin